jgi:hypothetical protein
MDSEINKELWRKAIYKALKDRLFFGKLFFSETGVPLKSEDSFTKHKYFAFRVENINQTEKDSVQVYSYVMQAAKGLVSVFEKDLMTFILGCVGEDIPAIDIPSEIRRFQVAAYFNDDLRVQSAYDLDYLATSIVGDVTYTIGIVKSER